MNWKRNRGLDLSTVTDRIPKHATINENNWMYIRNTMTVTIGIVVLLIGLLIFLGITGDHDASVNKAEYTRAMQVCQRAAPQNVALCVTNVDQHFSNHSGD